MIEIFDRVFKLSTINTSYIFALTEEGHAEHVYYGRRIPDTDVGALRLKNTIILGTTVDYQAKRIGYSLDTMPLEYSGNGKGDFRHSPIELIMPDGSFVTDFIYDGHSLTDGAIECEDAALPYATGKAQTLSVGFKDKKYDGISLVLNYTVFEDCDVIARSVRLKNSANAPIYIRKLMSFMMDMPAADYKMLTLDGGWAKEAHLHEREVSYGILVNDSTTGIRWHRPGASSRRFPGPGWCASSQAARPRAGWRRSPEYTSLRCSCRRAR